MSEPSTKPPPRWAYWLSGQPLFNGLSSAYRWVRSGLERIPAFEVLDGFAAGVTRKIYRVLQLPAGLEARLEPWLEIDAGRRVDPVLALALFALFAGLGLYPSYLGHMDTTPYLFSVLPFVGVFNPYLGLCAGTVFAVFDWSAKWLYPLLSILGSWVPVESVYGGNWSDGLQNFLGARAGYFFAYSTVLLTALAPGILARVLRRVFYRVASAVIRKPAAAAMVGGLLFGAGVAASMALPGTRESILLAAFPLVLVTTSAASLGLGATAAEAMAQAVATLGNMAGAALGGGLSNGYAQGPGNYLAFEAVRADPDLSCRALSAGNYMTHLPATMTAAGLAGLFPPGSAGALVLGGPPTTPPGSVQSQAPGTQPTAAQPAASAQSSTVSAPSPTPSPQPQQQPATAPYKVVLSGPDAKAWLEHHGLWTPNGPAPGFESHPLISGMGHDPEKGMLAIVVPGGSPGMPPPPPAVSRGENDPGPYYRPPGQPPAPPPTPAPPTSKTAGPAPTTGQPAPTPAPPDSGVAGSLQELVDDVEEAGEGLIAHVEGLAESVAESAQETGQDAFEALEEAAQEKARKALGDLDELEGARAQWRLLKGDGAGDPSAAAMALGKALIEEVSARSGWSKMHTMMVLDMDADEFQEMFGATRAKLEAFLEGTEDA